MGRVRSKTKHNREGCDIFRNKLKRLWIQPKPLNLLEKGCTPYETFETIWGAKYRKKVVKVQTKNEQSLIKLKKMVDAETYDLVMTALAGELVYFPITSAFVDKEERNQAIRSEFYKGADIAELAEKYTLSQSHIRKIIQNYQASR